ARPSAWCRAHNSDSKRARASGLGSPAASSLQRGSARNVGAISTNPRPSPITPIFNGSTLRLPTPQGKSRGDPLTQRGSTRAALSRLSWPSARLMVYQRSVKGQRIMCSLKTDDWARTSESLYVTYAKWVGGAEYRAALPLEAGDVPVDLLSSGQLRSELAAPNSSLVPAVVVPLDSVEAPRLHAALLESGGASHMGKGRSDRVSRRVPCLPCTTRWPRLTWVSLGNPFLRLLVWREGGAFCRTASPATQSRSTPHRTH